MARNSGLAYRQISVWVGFVFLHVVSVHSFFTSSRTDVLELRRKSKHILQLSNEGKLPLPHLLSVDLDFLLPLVSSGKLPGLSKTGTKKLRYLTKLEKPHTLNA